MMFQSDRIQTEGTIVDVTQRMVYTRRFISKMVFPIIRYEDQNGQPHLFESKVGRDLCLMKHAKVDVGKKVIVRYSPNHPETAYRVENFWRESMPLIVIGILFGVASIGIFLAVLKFML